SATSVARVLIRLSSRPGTPRAADRSDGGGGCLRPRAGAKRGAGPGAERVARASARVVGMPRRLAALLGRAGVVGRPLAAGAAVARAGATAARAAVGRRGLLGVLIGDVARRRLVAERLLR